MSSAPDGQAAIRPDTRAFEIEMLADDFLAFIAAFEASHSEGDVPPVFAERLAQLQLRADRLI